MMEEELNQNQNTRNVQVIRVDRRVKTVTKFALTNRYAIHVQYMYIHYTCTVHVL